VGGKKPPHVTEQTEALSHGLFHPQAHEEDTHSANGTVPLPPEVPPLPFWSAASLDAPDGRLDGLSLTVLGGVTASPAAGDRRCVHGDSTSSSGPAELPAASSAFRERAAREPPAAALKAGSGARRSPPGRTPAECGDA